MKRRHACWVLGLGVALACAALPSAAFAGISNRGLPGATSDPIANMTWGYYTGTTDDVYPSYQAASGANKQLLAEVALRPEAYWFGHWNLEPQKAIAGYVGSVQNGNQNVLAQVSDFGIAPWENHTCGVNPSASEVSAYHTWTQGYAAGIGKSRVLVVLQPDLPVADAKCIPKAGRTKYGQMVTFAAKTFNALPYTTVYIDAGAGDWLKPPGAAALLARSGIRYARGFALNATHYDATGREIAFGAAVVKALAKLGIKGKHFIVDTAENGHPFTHQAYTSRYGTGKGWAARPGCVKGKHVAFCQSFGIPPTWQVGLSQWHLGKQADALADKYVDGYVWFGRPWLHGQSGPFDPSLVEQMASSTPFPYPKYGEPPGPNAVTRFGAFGARPGEAIRS